METLNIKAKDIIQYVVYLITLIAFIIKIDNKVDKLSESVAEMKIEKKEGTSEQRQNIQIIQTELKTLNVTAELNKQNISLNKADIIIINLKLDKLLNK